MVVRILKNTPQELVLCYRPYFQYFFGVVIMAYGVGCGAMMFETMSFECHRSTEVCVRKETQIFLPERSRSYDLSDLTGARVVLNPGVIDSHSLEFLIRGRNVVPLREASIWGEANKREALLEVERFAQDPEVPSLRVEESNIINALIIGLVIIGIGLALFLSGKFKRFWFSVPEGRLIISTSSVFGNKTREIPLREVAGAYLSSFENEQRETYRAYIELKDGEMIPLTETYSNVSGAQRHVKAIQAFLNQVRGISVQASPGGGQGFLLNIGDDDVLELTIDVKNVGDRD